MRTKRILKTLKIIAKNERTGQRTHGQNYAYVNKTRRTYIRDVRQLSNPGGRKMMTNKIFSV